MPTATPSHIVRCICVTAALILAACSKPSGTADHPAANKPAPMTMKALVAATAGQFQPVPLPDPKIPGYQFPESEDTIIGWTKSNNQKAMNLHAWGIWTALTQISDQTFDGQKLRTFETWYDPSDLMSTGVGPAAVPTKIRQPRRLQVPRQFEHGGVRSLAATAGVHGDQTILAFVKYDPSGSDHILKNNLFSAAQLTTLLNTDHKASVPDFPTTSVSLKPVFETLPASKLVNGRYFQLSSWPGPPPLVFNQSDQLWHSKPFPQSAWGQCIWIDIQDAGRKPGTMVDKTCAANGSSRTDGNTYGVDQFIHFQLTKADADLANAEAKKLQPAAAAVAAGDYAVLVAMHVTSREITRWTWQTFWWTYDPQKPAAPSSPAIAADRPPQLMGAARNYAHCVAYEEVSPPQPASGGSNTGESVYCYNPYLEAPFSPAILSDSQPGMTKRNGQSVKTANDVGVQTNCMSCHEQANYNPNNVATAPNYTGDRYVDLTGPAFQGVLKVDFLWSIPGNAN